jgi:hypothetical protein
MVTHDTDDFWLAAFLHTTMRATRRFTSIAAMAMNVQEQYEVK